LIIGSYLRQSRPAAVVVQGDTASAYAGALAAQEFAIPVVHLEAGLRTHDLRSPFPEEAYRRNITRIAALHLAPSALAVQQLLHEGIRLDRIAKIGSTAIDGLRRANPATANRVCDLLVDIHRRENSGRALRRLVDALNKLALSGWRICIAEQPNENWNERWSEALGETCCLTRLPQLDREGWLAQSSASRCVLSDSGAAAEELPYLGVPLLIYRRCCERPEAILSGHARLLSPQAAGLLDDEIENCLRNEDWPPPWPFLPTSPYGDGLAGMRAASVIAGWLPNARQSIRAAV